VNLRLSLEIKTGENFTVIGTTSENFCLHGKNIFVVSQDMMLTPILKEATTGQTTVLQALF
jgi:hypothetical protein